MSTGRSPSAPSRRRLVALFRGALVLVHGASPRRFVRTSILQLTAGGAAAVALLLGRDALDAVLAAGEDGRDVRSLVPALVPVVLVSAYRRVADVVVASESSFLADEVGRAANDRILDVTTEVEVESFEDPAFLDELDRASASSSRSMEIVNGVLGLLGNGFGLVGLVWAVFTVQPALVPLMVLGGIPLWLASLRNSRDAFRTDLELVESRRRRQYLRNILSSRDGADEVRAFALADAIRERYDREYDRWMQARRELQRRRMVRTLVALAVGSVLAVALLGVLLALYLEARLGLSAALVAVYGARQLRQRIGGVLSGIGSLYESALYLDGVQAFMDLRPGIAASRPTATVDGPFHRLAVEDVWFTYPGTDRPVLRGVSLEIRSGEVIALVGANGCGKTTLAKLICQLYRPQSGRILWDGVDTAAVDPRSTRRSIAVVLQDFVRYRLDARSSIALGRPDDPSDPDAVVLAAREAGADGFLSALSHGYDTVLGRVFAGSEDLSIGQWQRVALARAFYRDAAFLVLDEPTSSLDAQGEQDLFEGLRRLFRGRSVLFISHRMSSVRSADRIYVLDRGRIVEHGSHDELMAVAGIYSELFTLQAGAYA
jgi:ATP-binding cassette subfamily B protein